MSKKPLLFQGVNCGQLAGLNFANHALRPAIGETLHEFVGNSRRISTPAGSSLGDGQMLHCSDTRPNDSAVPRRFIVNDESADASRGDPNEAMEVSFAKLWLISSSQ